CLRTLQGHTSWVISVVLTPDGKTAISASLDKTLRIWDIATGECLRTFQGYTDEVTSVTVAPDGKTLVSTSSDHTLGVFDITSGEHLRNLGKGWNDDPRVGHTYWVTSVALTSDGKTAVSAGWDKTLRVWDIASGECLRTLQGHTGEVISVAVTPDGKTVISASMDSTLRVWNIVSGECLATYHTGVPVWSVSEVRQNGQLVCGTADGQLHFLKLRNL
ncbi:MAG: WD40 repeat domain-containing protein, partial [Nitrospira sp.]|nr:WD40 repeat domain-containing protein [Nitrospira sp.]